MVTYRKSLTLLIVASITMQGCASKPQRVVEKPITAQDVVVMRKSIDARFVAWGGSWMIDRYVTGSTLIGEAGAAKDGVLVRGTFDFIRWGQEYQIPFASTLKRHPAGWTVTNLCYNDTSSGMTDCTDSGGGGNSNAVMGMVILGGIAAALAIGAMGGSSDNGSSDRQSRNRAHDRMTDESIQRDRDDRQRAEKKAKEDEDNAYRQRQREDDERRRNDSWKN